MPLATKNKHCYGGYYYVCVYILNASEEEEELLCIQFSYLKYKISV